MAFPLENATTVYEQGFLDFGSESQEDFDLTKKDNFAHLLFENPDQSLHQNGWFSILQNNPYKRDYRQKSENGGKKDYKSTQSSYPLNYLKIVADGIDRNLNTYISQSTFTKPNRRIVNLWRMGVLWVDLDTYNTDFGHNASISKQVDRLLWMIENVYDYPEPSMVVFSGRGLYVKWLHSPLPRDALPRWNAAMRTLNASMLDIGADPKAKDASRVLRIIGTKNSKSDAYAEIMHLKTDANGQPYRYDFEYLMEYILPLSRAQAEERKKQAILRHEAFLEKQKKYHAGLLNQQEIRSMYPNLREISGQKLSWDRVEDLRHLVHLRKTSGEGVEGCRELMLFWQMNHLLLSRQVNLKNFWAESYSLAHELDSQWAKTEGKGTLESLFSKARMLANGERVKTPDGREITPLYTAKNQTLMDIFKITPHEEKQMRTIISKAEGHRRTLERDVQRKKEERRKIGMKEQLNDQQRAKVLRTIEAEKMSLRKASAYFDIPKSTIANWLKENNLKLS